MSIGSSTKAQLRAERLAARDALSVEERMQKSLAISAHGIATIELEAGTIVSGFLPIRSEADTIPMMSALREKHARLCVPVVLDRENIIFREFLPETALISGSFGTLGPGPDAAELDPQIMLVPLSAFDRKGHRIGYGGGYYDRAIHRLRQKGMNPRLIGIAFDCQEVASVPSEPHDIRLDAILTESGYRPFGE